MAMIQISDEWRITGDPYCWIVEQLRGERRNKKTGEMEPDWRYVTFHQSLGAAAKSLALRRLRTADVEGVAAMVEAWESIAAEIDAAFERWRDVA